MPGCAAIGCNNRSEKGYTMKCFPRNPNLRKIWKERVSRADWEPSNNSFLCHVHFDSDQWILSQSCRLKLKKNAIPSIFTVTSTRKSPRKRRKLLNGEAQDLDYLDESLDPVLTVKNTIRNRFASHYGAKAIKSSNGMHDANSRRIDREVVEIMTNSEPKVKPEMKSQLESDQDLDDIERKLRLICDGESETNEKTDCANGRENENKYCLDYSKENGESASDKDLNNIREAIDRKRKSRYEIMRDIEKTVGIVDVKTDTVNVDLARKSTFTIKVTGLEEDVEEIVEGLGSEQFKYKTSNESSKNNRRLVTSVISVIDNSSSVVSALKKPKLEIDESPPNDTEIDWKWQGNGNLAKLSMESPDDDESSIYKRLREKVKFQEEVIRKLTDQLMTRVEPKITANSVNSKEHERESTKKKKMDINPGNNLDVHESLVNGLSTRLNNLEEINKSLNKRLSEKEQEKKKMELQIRQRDNRIKELNWKLDKASKYVERAEKNTITYRKKMINMQSLIARRKISDKKMETAEIERSEKKNLESRITQKEEDESIVEVAEEQCIVEDQNTLGNSGLYRTVQDIFDESNDCDDDPYVIDNREDFIREFKDTFERPV